MEYEGKEMAPEWENNVPICGGACPSLTTDGTYGCLAYCSIETECGVCSCCLPAIRAMREENERLRADNERLIADLAEARVKHSGAEESIKNMQEAHEATARSKLRFGD